MRESNPAHVWMIERSRYELLALRREMAEIAKLEAETDKVVAEMEKLRASRSQDMIRTIVLVVGVVCVVASTVSGWLQLW